MQISLMQLLVVALITLLKHVKLQIRVSYGSLVTDQLLLHRMLVTHMLHQEVM